jgi:RNA polymerase sigma factor (sigma-70 family)
MMSLESLVHSVREGDDEAYSIIVRRFQDMAVGYGYSILRDFQLAEDAAQEAFFEAYRNLGQLRVPAAFPGWFRRIVFKQCDRITRGKHPTVVPLEAAEVSCTPTQADVAEEHEMKDRLLSAIDCLPEHERSATMLFYMSGYTQDEIADFLGVPTSTIKKRLFSARKRLRDMLIDMVEDSLREKRPSRDEAFTTRVIEILKAARSGDVDKVKLLLEEDPRLIAARDPLGNTALILAVNSGHKEIAELLTEAGVRPDMYEAASIGRIDLVQQFLNDDPSLLDSYSPEGFSALALAAHFGKIEVLKYLIARGADLNSVSTHPINVTPLHAALFGKQLEAANILVASGANVKLKRGGRGWPRAGWTALHYAAGFGFVDLARTFIDSGAEIEASDDYGKTPLQVATEAGHPRVVNLLTEQLNSTSHDGAKKK